MPSEDVRKDFIVATTGNYFGIQSSDNVLAEVTASKELNVFLDDGNSLVLAAKYDVHQGKKTINLLNHVEPSDTAEKVLVFFKLRPEAITPDNVHENVFVSSMLSSPVNTLYHSVQKLFAPLLLKDEKWSRNFDPKLQSLLSELEAGLGSVVRKQDSSSSRAANVGDEENLGGIFIVNLVHIIFSCVLLSLIICKLQTCVRQLKLGFIARQDRIFLKEFLLSYFSPIFLHFRYSIHISFCLHS